MKKLIIYGRHSCKNVMANPQRKIERIFCTNNTIDLIPLQLEKKVELTDKSTIEKYLQKNEIHHALHQDIVVVTQQLQQVDLHEIIGDSQLLVLLDELQDSQNIGAIIRSTALLNGDAVISTLHNSPEENAHILKAACGAFEHIPLIKVTNLSQTIKILKENNFWLVGMSCNAKDSLHEISDRFNSNEKIAIVVGNEENGMRSSIEKHCDFLITIPINKQRGVDSLNASNSTAIFLYEINKLLSTNS